MLDRILIGSSAEPTDANFKNVTLLLHGDGSNGAQNNTFIDSSTNNFTITRNGNTTQGSFSPYGSNWSNYFDGTGDYLTAPSNAAFGFGTNDYTVEAWVCPTSIPARENLVYCTDTTGGLTFYYNQTQVAIGRRATAVDLTATYTLPIGVWTHLAVSRQGGTTRIYVNGTQVASTTTSYNYPSGQAGVGDYPTIGNLGVIGYLSNVRVVTGTAVYTSAFTPPTQPLTAITNTSLLTCAYNRFRDGSTNNFTITRNGDVKVTNFAPFAPSSSYSTTTNGGSAYFDGSGDYLLAPNNTALDVWDSGSGNFTVEAWIYPTVSMPNNCSVVGKAEMNGDPGWTAGWAFQAYNGKLNVNTAGDTRLFNSNTTDIPVGAWSHVVLVKSSSTVSIFQNGTRVATITNSSSYSNTSNQVHIGTDRNTAGSKFTGWMAGIRMVKGTAVYDPTQSTLTVPTSPPTAVTNTNLLLNATNAAIFDNSMKNDLETVGNAQISTSVKKFGTGSMAFDGAGDRLILPANAENRINTTGNFTIEFWAYFNSAASDQRLIGWDNSANNYVIALYTNSSGNLAYYLSSTGTSWDIAVAQTVGSISANTWYHIALVRNGSTFTPYINGVAGTATTSSSALYSSTLSFAIGSDNAGNSPFNGYIDDFRITKGVARYTANFTPPTAPFPNK